MGYVQRCVGLGVVVCLVCWGGAAVAGCTVPPGDVVWQYPAHGEEDVPLNAAVWVHASGTSVSVKLDGVLLAAVDGQPRFETPEMEANTTYTLEVEALGSPSRVITTTFTTGSSRWSGDLDEPTLDSFEYDETGVLVGQLPELATFNTCFDVGAPRSALFNFTSTAFALQVSTTLESRDRTIHVTSRVWPSEFGPVVILDNGVPGEGCFDVISFAVTGEQRRSKVCVPEDADPPTHGSHQDPSYLQDGQDGGVCCAVRGGSGGSAVALVWMVGVGCLLIRRRRDPTRPG